MNNYGKITQSRPAEPMPEYADTYAIIPPVEQALPHCAVMLVLDTSHSMWGEGLRDMKDSLHAFYAKLNQMHGTIMQTDIAAVSMGENLRMLEEFTPFEQSHLPEMNIRPKGDTPIGAALNLALLKLRDQWARYEQNGWAYLPSRLIVLSDGQSTDDISDVVREIQALASSGRLSCDVVVTGSAPNMDALGSIAGENIRLPVRGEMKQAFNDIGQRVCRSCGEEKQKSSELPGWEIVSCDFSGQGGEAPAYVLDGTNIIHWAQSRSERTLKYLLAMARRFREEGTPYQVFFDASTLYILPERERGEYKRLLADYPDTFLQVPSGTQADDFILQVADALPDCRVISKDHFREYRDKYPWIAQGNRVIQGMIAGDCVIIPEINFNVSA